MRAQRIKIAILWLGFSGLIFALLLVQTILGRYSDHALEPVWKWFLPLVMPTLILILERFVAEEQRGLKDQPPKSNFMFRLCMALSLFYLMLPLIQLLSIPIGDPENPLAWLEKSKIWIVAVQTLPFTALGVFFHKKDTAESPAQSPR